jgi:hypothetical protein
MRALKYIPILLLPCFAACNKYDIQPGQAEGFIKFFSSDLGQSGVDVKPTSDGGYIAIGNSTDPNTGLKDIYLVKTDQYGNEESWSPVILGNENFDDVATSLQVVSDGFVILGYTNDTTGGGNGSYDMYLLKTDLQGNVVWEKKTGGSADDRGTNLQVTSGGNFLAGGITSTYTTNAGPRNAYIVLFDASGNYIRSGYFGEGDPTPKTVFDTYVIETATDIVVCGSLGTIDPEVSQIFVAVRDKNNFGPKNFKKIGTGTNHYGVSVQEKSNGNVIICGQAFNASGNIDLYLEEFTTNLVSVWQNTLTEAGETSDLAAGSLRFAPDGGLAIIGTRTETENDDIFLIFTDAGGNLIGDEITLFGDDGYQQGAALEFTTSDNGWIIVGTNGFEDNSMMALLKTDGQGGL